MLTLGWELEHRASFPGEDKVNKLPTITLRVDNTSAIRTNMTMTVKVVCTQREDHESISPSFIAASFYQALEWKVYNILFCLMLGLLWVNACL